MQYLGSSNRYRSVLFHGKKINFEVYRYIEFTSSRKRASIILKDGDVIKHYIKGADSEIISRQDKSIEQPFLNETNQKQDTFSRKGFRTLCFAMKVYSQKEYVMIENKLNMLENNNCDNIDEIETHKRIEEFNNEIEQNFTLIGCTAVEDKLQDNVPEVICDFIRADIKVWMLTGDKLETAENIGFSCGLIRENYEMYYIKEDDDLEKKFLELKENFSKKKKLIKNTENPEINQPVENDDNNFSKVDNSEVFYKTITNIVNTKKSKKKDKKCILIEGMAADKILTNNDQRIIKILMKADSVICCRLSPKIKGEIVYAIKSHKKCTLAIGDGANDVQMIQEADIGIGIVGLEGTRALQACDYALPDFKSLWKLLMVHGRWCYIRNSELILYFFYKNMIFSVPQIIFCFYNGYSGQSVFDDWYISFYNLAWTSFPLIIKALFDKDFYYKSQIDPSQKEKSRNHIKLISIQKMFKPKKNDRNNKKVVTFADNKELDIKQSQMNLESKNKNETIEQIKNQFDQKENYAEKDYSDKSEDSNPNVQNSENPNNTKIDQCNNIKNSEIDFLENEENLQYGVQRGDDPNLVEIQHEILQLYPYLYYIGQNNEIYTLKNLFLWMLQSVFVGFTMFLVCQYSIKLLEVDSEGHNSDIWFFSLTVYTGIVLIVDVKLIVITRTWTIQNIFGVLFLSLGIYFPFVFMCDYIPSVFKTAYTAKILFGSPIFWLMQFIYITTIMCMDLMIKVSGKHFVTNLHDLFKSVLNTKKKET